MKSKKSSLVKLLSQAESAARRAEDARIAAETVLRDEIRRCGLSQSHLSRISGVPQQYISLFLAGNTLSLRQQSDLADSLKEHIQHGAIAE